MASSPLRRLYTHSVKSPHVYANKNAVLHPLSKIKLPPTNILKDAHMKWLISISVTAFIALPAVAANTKAPTLKETQQACELKRVTHQCSIVHESNVEKGICIDAKRYGLVCSQRKSVNQ